MDLSRGLQQLTGRAGQKAAAPEIPTGPSVFGPPAAPSRTLAQREARKHLSVYGGSDAIDWVADAVWLIAETAGGAEFHFEAPSGEELVTKKAPTDPDEVTEAPADLLRLFNLPNPWTTWSDLFALTVIDYLLIGNSYWLKVTAGRSERPVAFYRLQPDRMQVIAGERSPIDHYEYKVPNAAEPIRFSVDEIVHFRRPNPHSEQFGLGVVQQATRPLDVELALVDSQATFFEQGTRLSGVLETDRSLPHQIIKKMRTQFQQLYSGAKNSYKVAVLERGLTFKTVQANAVEAEYKELSKQSRDRIAAMFRVPLPLLGAFENADRQAVKEAQRIFDNNTMKPLLKKLAETINLHAIADWDLALIFDYEYQLPIEDQIELAESFAALPGVKVSEVRARVGLAPLGDDRDDIVLNMPGENDNDSKIKDRRNREGGRPPKGENTAAFPEDAAVA